MSLLPGSTVVISVKSCKFKVLGTRGFIIPTLIFKKRRGYCNRLRPSVCLSVRLSVMLSPPKPLDETQPNLWCVSYWHEWGVQRQTFFWPRPLGPWGGVKRSNIIKFQLQSQFQRFLYQTLCVFSQLKDTKHIRRDFNSVAWVMTQGWDFGGLGVPRGSKKFFFFQTWSCGISNWRGWRAEQNASKIFILESNWWPWGEVKGQISLNICYHVNFKDFYTKFCVCAHKWKIQNISDRIFILSPGSCLRGQTLGH